MRSLLVALASLYLAGCSCSGDLGTADGGRNDSGGSQHDGASGDSGPPGPPPDVYVRITTDNAYGFGYGSPSGLANYFNGREAVQAEEIFICSATCDASTPCATGACDMFGTCNDDGLGPETYVVRGSDTNAGDYLYVIAWSDNSVTQGALGQFIANTATATPIYTGTSNWEVCATGMDYAVPSGGPPRDVIDAQIVVCGNGGGVSQGWLGTTARNNMVLAVGENNAAGTDGDFPDTCTDMTHGDSISTEARWMWFDDDITDALSPFHSDGSGHGEFLIFRLQVADLLF